jgi:heme oxygenase (biliverdin-IX-beta and delta-forming)
MFRTMLRARTAALHDELDRMVNSFCIGDSLRLGRLLAIHYDALWLLVPALERARADHVCPGWEARSRLAAIEEDLKVLHIRPYRTHAHPPLFVREPEIWGALYAIEGSRLGNRILLRHVTEFGGEKERRATQFLSHGLENGAVWGNFVAQLDDLRYCDEAIELAVLGAERVFKTYLNSAERFSE